MRGTRRSCKRCVVVGVRSAWACSLGWRMGEEGRGEGEGNSGRRAKCCCSPVVDAPASCSSRVAPLQWKIASWVSLFACLSSIARMKTSDIEFKQVFGPFMYVRATPRCRAACSAACEDAHCSRACASFGYHVLLALVLASLGLAVPLQVRADGHHHQLFEPRVSLRPPPDTSTLTLTPLPAKRIETR